VKSLTPSLAFFRFYFSLIAAAGLMQGCGKKHETIRPEEHSITESVYASGVVKSRRQYSVYPAVAGTVEEILVAAGDEVKKGQPIIRLKNTTANLAAENARVAARFAEVNQNRERLSELQAALDVARARAHNDSLLMVRQKKLFDENVGTRVDWEQRQLAFVNSSATYQSAAARLHELQRQINLAAEQSRLQANMAGQQLLEFTIASTIDGRVYDIQRQPGEAVSPQTPVAVIGDAHNFYLELDIDETDIARVKPGQRVLISLSSHPMQTWEGVVDRINPIMNERSKLFTVEASFTQRPETLFPNLTAEANILINFKNKTLTIPAGFLLNDTTVLLQSGERRVVQPGLRDYQRVEILRGISGSDVLQKPGK
jgi:multidrug resistance efflux pump